MQNLEQKARELYEQAASEYDGPDPWPPWEQCPDEMLAYWLDAANKQA